MRFSSTRFSSSGAIARWRWGAEKVIAMAYSMNVETGERVVLVQDVYEKLLGEPFFIAATDRALYFPVRKPFAISDPYATRRLPLSDVRQISVRSVRSPIPLILGLLLLLFGMYAVIDDFHKGRVPALGARHVFTASLLLIGLIGRRALVVDTVRGTHVWKYSTRQKGRDILDGVFTRVLAACRTVGVQAVAADLERD